jgi:CelD/BcsL family acetyltransferase involved in cellulose biosynthesis
VTTATLEVQADSSESCFELSEWRSLLANDPNSHIFATPEWNRLWWEEFGAGKDLMTLTMRHAGRVLAVVPLYRKREGGRDVLRFVGGIDLSDYLGPICARPDGEGVAEALVEWLKRTDFAWDELDAHNMAVPFGFAEYLVDHADRAGFDFVLDQEETAAILPLPGDWDSYLASLAGKERHELRRKRRRLLRDHPEARVRTSTPDTLEDDLRIFFDMHRGAEGHKGHFLRPEIADFFGSVARSFLPLGWLRLDFLEVGGRAVACTFSLELDGRFYLYNSAFEPDAGRLSPGLMLVSELVHDSIDRGLQYFDFLRGPERYKYQLGAQPVPLNNVRVFRA